LNTLLFDLAVFFATVKVLSTVLLARWPGGTMALYTHPVGRLIGWSGKISPILFVACLLARAYLSGYVENTLLFGVLLIAVIVAVGLVVYLRKRGKWYGLAHTLRTRLAQRKAGASDPEADLSHDD
jgi:hypothetical protein